MRIAGVKFSRNEVGRRPVLNSQVTARRYRSNQRLAPQERLRRSYFQRRPNFFEQLLAKNRNHRYNAIKMNDPSQIGRPAARRSAALRARRRHMPLQLSASQPTTLGAPRDPAEAPAEDENG
jgi:hypothetical protein